MVQTNFENILILSLIEIKINISDADNAFLAKLNEEGIIIAKFH